MGRVVIPGFRKIETSGEGEGGTSNYDELTNKPSINNVPLVGNLNTANLKLTDATLTEEGVPAEAKTVGAKLAEQSTSLTAIKEELTKKANISDIPTKVSELQNDSNYQTDTDVTTTLTTYATKTYVGEQISSADHLKREIVTDIPSSETADKNTIYMLKIESATGNDKYREYLLIDGTVQCVGDTSVDLTDYAKKTEIPTELPANGGNSLTVNGHTVNSDVPANAKFTDTTYNIATSSSDGLMSKEHVSKLNNMQIKTYTSIESLGLSGTPTVNEIKLAMPLYSELLIEVNLLASQKDTEGNTLDNASCRIVKLNSDGRAWAEAHGKSDGKHYVMRLGNGDSAPNDFTEIWEQIAMKSDNNKLLSLMTNNTSYVDNFSGNENANNAPQGIRKGQLIIGHPSRFEDWVMYQTYYYDSGHQYGWQLAFNMSDNGIAYRYRRNSTWNDWAYLVLES